VLKGIDELISADLLYVLAAMGHGDQIAVVDRNFPAVSTARRLVRIDDTFVEAPVLRMEMVGSPDELPRVQNEFLALCEASEHRPITMGSLTRETFYERTRQAFAVVVTSESRPYGCFLLTKGVIFES
jgi:L-fucose mutarotase